MRTRTSSAVRPRAARVVAAVAVAGMAIALGVPGGTSVGDAASPFVAGGPVTARTPVAGDRAAVALFLRALRPLFGALSGRGHP